MMSLPLRIWTPWPDKPGTQAALSGCVALAPNPEESIRKCEVGEQSSKCQKPEPPPPPEMPPDPICPPKPEPPVATPPSPPGIPPIPTLPPAPKLPPTLPPAPRLPAVPVLPPAPILPATPVLPPAPGRGAPAASAAGRKVVSPPGPMTLVPSGVPITASASGSAYSSYVSAANLGSTFSVQPPTAPEIPAINPTTNLPLVHCLTRIPSIPCRAHAWRQNGNALP